MPLPLRKKRHLFTKFRLNAVVPVTTLTVKQGVIPRPKTIRWKQANNRMGGDFVSGIIVHRLPDPWPNKERQGTGTYTPTADFASCTRRKHIGRDP
jgi:hypothetical protein